MGRTLLVALTALTLSACAAPQQVQQTATPSETVQHGSFIRRTAPFPVAGPDGIPYAQPFLGGLNQPRPQFVDIDADGDPDLFLQDRSDRLMFFENVGSGAAPAFSWRTDTFQDLAVGDWYRFGDLDRDGDPDLLAESPYSLIRYYENTGAPGAPVFTLAADTLKDAAGVPIFSDRQNIPNVNDIDCDGLLDLFIGRLDGTVTRYEEVAEDAGAPIFQWVTDRFEGIEIVALIAQPGVQPAPIPGGARGGPATPVPGSGPSAEEGRGPSLHGANTLVFYDYDADNDADLFWGDFFEPGLLLIENTGSCQEPILRGEPVPFPISNPLLTTGYNAPAFTDIDADGDQDLFVGVLGGAYNPNRSARDNFYFYEQTAPNSYALRTRQFLTGLDVGNESAVAPGDLDGDGDVDLLIANKIGVENTRSAEVVFWRKDGALGRPAYVAADTLAVTDSYNFAPELGDLDTDGDLDLLLGTWNDGVAYYRNTGDARVPRFERVEAATITLTRGSHSTPALIDIDADGDLDLFVGETSGALNFYRNTGAPSEPRFEFVTDTFGGIDAGRRSAPAFSDIDGDGDADLFLGSDEGLVFLRNTGTPTEASFQEDPAFDLNAPAMASPAPADFDGDGDLDLLIGGIGGGLIYYENVQ